MVTLVVLPPSFSVASFSIFARLTLKKGEDGDHDGVQLQEEDGEHAYILKVNKLAESAFQAKKIGGKSA